MAQTKASDMIKPQVLKDMIGAELEAKIKFAPLMTVDRTLVGQPGDTITIPRFQYIGDAEDLAEGIAMGTVVLTTSSQSVTVKEAGKAVEITDKAILSGYGDPVGEATRQLKLAIANKIDNDGVEALKTATLVGAPSANPISYGAVVDAVDLFEEEDDEARILFVHPLQKGTLRKDPEFVENVANAYMTGVIGEIAGCQVVASKKVPFNEATQEYTNFIVKAGALGLFLKQDVEVETDRDILARTNVISAFEHYVVALADESKAAKFVVKK